MARQHLLKHADERVQLRVSLADRLAELGLTGATLTNPEVRITRHRRVANLNPQFTVTPPTLAGTDVVILTESAPSLAMQQGGVYDIRAEVTANGIYEVVTVALLTVDSAARRDDAADTPSELSTSISVEFI